MFSLAIYDMNEYHDEGTLQGPTLGKKMHSPFTIFCIILRVVFLLFI
jgi:hypothetical protein